jgi:tetratricopeptide (TPR) repeat protein
VGWPYPVADYVVASVAKEYGWSYQLSPGGVRDDDTALQQTWPNSDVTLLAIAKTRGAQATIEKYRDLKNATSAQPVVNQNSLIGLSYALSRSNQLPDAIEILKAEVQEYPSYWNGYDTLGEMYARAGNKQLAIQNYEKSIELNPQNDDGIAILKKLRSDNN